MPSNDTENIYATQYGGAGEPIPATKISYDNTDSGLTATKVQGAIDELAGDIAGLTGEDVAYDNTESGLTADDVQAAIDEVATVTNEVKDNYVISGHGTVAVNADGTKDFDALLDDLKTEITAVLATIDADELLVPKNLYITSFYSLVADYTSGWSRGTTNFTPSFSRAGGSAAKGIIARAVLADTNEMYAWSIETTGNTVKNWLSDVPTNAQSLTFYYQKIKQV